MRPFHEEGTLKAVFAAVILVVSFASAEDDVAGAVAKLVVRLGSDSVVDRDAAQRDLVALGARAEDPVRAARAAATDPEVSSRLDAVISGYKILHEEAYALERVAAGEPFPQVKAPEGVEVSLQGVCVLEFVKRLSKWSGVPIEFYAPTSEKAQRLGGVTARASQTDPDEAARILSEGIFPHDFLWVVDAGRVVLVRATPPLLIAMCSRDPGEPSIFDLSCQLTWDKGHYDGWSHPCGFMRAKAWADPEVREPWFVAFQSVALDPSMPIDERRGALAALRAFLGDQEPQQDDVDKVFRDALREKGLSLGLRPFVLAGLAMGLSHETQDEVLALLDHGAPDVRKELLLALALAEGSHQNASSRIRMDTTRAPKYLASLRELSEDADIEVATRACLLRVRANEAAAGSELAKRDPPASLQDAFFFLSMLPRQELENEPRAVRAFMTDARPEARAIYLIVHEWTWSTSVAADDLAMLGDPAPMVRYFAAANLSVQLRNEIALGDDGVRRLREALAAETNDRVRERIRKILDPK